MLDFAPDVRPNSRLSCQLRMSAALPRVVELLREVRRLAKRVEELEAGRTGGPT